MGRSNVLNHPSRLQRSRVQILHGADHGPRIRMLGGISGPRDQFAVRAIRLVIALALFVLHHAALQIESLLSNASEQMAHAVGLQP